MYVLLVCFFFTAFIFIVFGKSFVLAFYKDERDNYGIFDSFFMGLCLVGTFLNALSLFFPVNIYLLILLLISAIFLVYRNKQYYIQAGKNLLGRLKSEKIFTALIFVATIITLFYAIVTPRNYDSYLYHINSIQWCEMYRAVPGLANFHDRFGFNSSIFVLSAGFSFSDLYNQYIFTISSLTYLVFFIWLLKQIYFKKSALGLFSLLFLYFFTQQYGFDISSPGTDLLPNILVGYLLLPLLFDEEKLKKKWLVYIILPLFCLTMKLSVLPIVILGLFAVIVKNTKPVKACFRFVLFGTLLILPWMIRNVILSGYIIYPIGQLDFFDFDWEVSKESITTMTREIGAWARVPMREATEVVSMSFTEWFSAWWNFALPKNQRFYILAAIIPIVFFIYSFFIKKVKTISFLVVCVAYFSFLFWFLTAPDVRFSFTLILFLALLPVFILKNQIDRFHTKVKPILSLGLILVLIIIGRNGYKLFLEDYISIKNVPEYSYLPIDVSTVKEKKNITFKQFLFVSKNGEKIILFEPQAVRSQCFDKFPCSTIIHPELKLRGDDLQDGFRCK